MWAVRRFLTILLVAVLALTGACSATAASGPVTIEVTIANGKVTPPTTAYNVSKGATVTLSITSDAADTVHVHGYEIEKPIAAGTTTVITFVADRTGRYEIETHTVVATIATLNVR